MSEEELNHNFAEDIQFTGGETAKAKSQTDNTELDELVNGMISSKLFKVKADAELWQVEIVQQITEKAKLAIEAKLKEQDIKSRINALEYCKKYMISTSPFIEEILQPEIDRLRSKA